MRKTGMEEKEFRQLMREIYKFNFKLSLLHKVVGLSPARCFEVPLAVMKLEIQKGQKLLDIGCGKSCFPLFMVKKGALVTGVDINGRAMVQMKYAKKVGIINHPIKEHFNVIDNPTMKIQKRSYTSNDGKFVIKVCDATKMDLPDSYFDAVSCISAIEHIPNNGDLLTMKEITRVLKPKGRAFISVPYGHYEEGKSHAGHFERRYNYEALHSRLIYPSGLKVKKIGFIFDKKSRKTTDAIFYKLPGYVRYIIGWSSIFFALLISKRDGASKDDAGLAYVVLEKR